MDDIRRLCEFCGLLKKTGIDFWNHRLIPGKLIQVTDFAPDCLVLETDEGTLALWIHHGQEAALASQNLLLNILKVHGLPNFLYPLTLNDNRTYASLDGRRWFYITPWPDTRRFFFHNPDHLGFLVDMLVDFRKAMEDGGAGYYMPDWPEKNNLLHKLAAIVDSLNSFALLARYRLKPTRFDSLFLKYYTGAIIQVKQALKRLVALDYERVLADITLNNRVINRLVRNNLRLSLENRVICLRCSDCAMDLPVVDLGTLLVKAGRSLQWSLTSVRAVLSRYQRVYSLQWEEQKVLLAFLACPWNFYRLAARYYSNRTAWAIGTYIERMERVIEGEPYRLDLLANLEKEFE